MLTFLFTSFILCSRELRNLHVSEGADGDCFASACSFDKAQTILRNGDIVIFEDQKISVTSYPSPISDLLHTATFMNVTLLSKDDNTIFDGRFMAGESLFDVKSAARFTWLKIKGFTFTNFEKPVMMRIISETPWPLIIFKDCTFKENKQDIFNLKGGTFQFDNCVFKQNLHRPIKAVTEAIVDIADCTFEHSESMFFFDCDISIKNSRFVECFGGRGGSLYLSKVTLNVDGCKFIRNKAKNNGGAIYIRESIEDYQCEIRRSAFVDNSAGVNGTAIYGYWADVIIRDNCFSDEESKAIFEFKSQNKKSGNEFKSKCTSLLTYEPKTDDFDPVRANPDYDIDIDVGTNSWIEL
ncbi:polymorphic repeat outer membrane protein [Tritrichomonas foetus]|uniref:Polymorphic repeat outer membrane protein n=1 Tax=Tritrichomonas foetus TaxID=1144522 RepID=A0A1J4JMR1_9EUKA|nr:polymorphic repeat outer membrane protein [Tritrichomonas foetus]|eukprot:OHS98532.1 polymorphic repeat outer membrane protein [Tritrichomonas foetus]